MLAHLKQWLKRMAFAAASPEMLLFLKHFQERRGVKDSPFSSTSIVCGDVPEARVLVLAPHPDDEVIGAGGVLALHRARGNRVLVVYLTDDNTQSGPAQGTRTLEAQELGRAFGFEQVFFGGEDSILEPQPDVARRLAALLDEFNPSQIYAPSYLDAHKDHIAAGKILHLALMARPQCAATVFGYEVWTCLPFPNHVFNITSVYNTKIRMLSHYPSQTRVVDFGHFCSARDNMRYAMHIDSLGRGSAEAFICCPATVYVEMFAVLYPGLGTSPNDPAFR